MKVYKMLSAKKSQNMGIFKFFTILYRDFRLIYMRS
jgi:hypothetical protein